MSRQEPQHDVDWSLGTWDGHDRAQMERWARMSLDDILRAQEEMAALSAELQGLRGTRADVSTPELPGRGPDDSARRSE